MKNQVYFWPIGASNRKVIVLERFPKKSDNTTAENGGEVHGEAGMITATCSLCKKSFDFLAGDPNAVPPRLCPECEL